MEKDGFFSASDTVTRKEWSEFIAHAKISVNLPGIQGVGFSLIIPAKQLLSGKVKLVQDTKDSMQTGRFGWRVLKQKEAHFISPCR